MHTSLKKKYIHSATLARNSNFLFRCCSPVEYYLIENIFSPSEEGEKNSSDSAASIYFFRGVSGHNNKVQRENTSFFGSYSALVD